MITAEHLYLKTGEKTILRDISLSINRGESLLLLGPNGAGKSTLLKVLAGLVRPTAGCCAVSGCIGFLSHGSFFYDRLTARENLRFYGGLYRVKDLGERIESLAEEVGLFPFLDERVESFSRGMVQRLSIARAILHRPAVLFLDEPYTGLDRRGAATLSRILNGFHEDGRTLVSVTHDFNDGIEFMNRVLILVRGTIVYDGLLSSKKEKTLRDLYLARVEESG